MAECTIMKARQPLASALFLNVLFCIGVAFADGGMFFPWDPRGVPEVRQPTQKVYIRWDGSQEKLLIQTRYEGPAEEMVWIVPVPSQPTVERGDAAVFDELREETAGPDLSYTDFAGLQSHGFAGSAGRSGDTSAVEWRRRVGDYDVVLLRPAGAENVLQWLNANEFAIPDRIAPVLEDYIRNGWWMVASRIHPDALSGITRDKLANGTLHPLEFAFESQACVYPLKLTGMAAGPVEELIYIEGPKHYEPVTFADEKWEIGLHGGLIRQVRDGIYLSDVEYVTEMVKGRATTTQARSITKLRRVFQPEEMVEDLYFAELDYAKWLASDDPLRVAQAATQYGRQRDANAIAHLVGALSPDALEQVKPAAEDMGLPLSARVLSPEGVLKWQYYWREPSGREGDDGYIHIGCTHIRSCIWALGEIALEQEVADYAEDVLVQCAEHDNQLIRMEAYLALMKLGSSRIGPIVSDQVTDVFDCFPLPVTRSYWALQTVLAEMEIVADWIHDFGAAQEKDALVDTLAQQIECTFASPQDLWDGPERQWSTPHDWTDWVVWRAAYSRDARLLTPLQELHARTIDDDHPVLPTLTRAEAACGSAQAATTVVEQIVGEESAVLEQGQAEGTGGIASLQNLFFSNASYPPSLRIDIIRKRYFRYQLYPMPTEAADAVLRSALSEEGLDDWYVLYLLARIRQPLAQDQERLLHIWNKGDEILTLVAADVLYAWGDEQILLDWYGRSDQPEGRAEIAWGLAQLDCVEATGAIEEQVRGSWNDLWRSFKQLLFLRPSSRKGAVPHDPVTVDAVRKAETLWSYFHPELGTLDDERLASLKRLTADVTIHPGIRVELLASNYGTTDWGKPLLDAAAMEVLEADSSPGTVGRLVTYTSNEFVVGLCRQAGSDEFLTTLLNNLLTSTSGSNLGVVEGLLWEVWPQRYRESGGESLLFREPGGLDFDTYHQYDIYGRTIADTLVEIVQDDSLPAGYRAFLVMYWGQAPQRIGRDEVEALLEGDLPDFIREGLVKRLPEWQ